MFRAKLASLIKLLFGLSLLLVACNPQEAEQKNSPTVTILGVMTGDGKDTMETILEPFEQETGIKVLYEGTDAFATLLPVRVESGNVPDIAMFPQPGLMADFAREGRLVPLETFMDRNQLAEAYSQDWLRLGSIDGKIPLFCHFPVFRIMSNFHRQGMLSDTAFNDGILTNLAL